MKASIGMEFVDGDDSEEQYKDASRRNRVSDSTNRERDGESKIDGRKRRVRGTQQEMMVIHAQGYDESTRGVGWDNG